MYVAITLAGVVVVLLGIIVFLVIRFDKERTQLITAIISKSAPEYAMSMEKLKTSPKDKLKQTKLENDLAIAAENLLNQADGKGIAVT